VNKLFADLLIKSAATGSPRIRQSRRGIETKSAQELVKMRQASRIVATVLKEIMGLVEPGQTTADLDAHAEQRIRAMGAVPSFKGYQGFPASICASINHEVVHGIPSRKRVIRDGDLLKVDTGACFEGFHGDSCVTIAVGSVSEAARRLSRVAQEALMRGLAQVRAGNTLLDIAGAVQDHVESHGYAVVEDYTGHGIGRNLHEEPSVFNYRTDQLPNVRLRPGMTLAVEPILNAGGRSCRTLRDGWTESAPPQSRQTWGHRGSSHCETLPEPGAGRCRAHPDSEG